MLYVVGVLEYSDGDRVFTLFETNTESFFGGRIGLLKRLIDKNKLDIINVKVDGNGTSIKKWYGTLHKLKDGLEMGTDYILMCQIDDDTFKLVSYDEKVIYVNTKELNRHIIQNKVANCILRDGSHKTMDTYWIDKNPQFEQSIAEQYKRYANMTALLGRKMSFDYILEGTEVKLKRYTGATKDVIVPKFITSIMQKAFAGTEIETLELEDGLKYIGYSAFESCNLSKVIIPQTVEFIGTAAFFKNKRLMTYNGGYIKNRLILLNAETQIVDPYQSDTLL